MAAKEIYVGNFYIINVMSVKTLTVATDACFQAFIIITHGSSQAIV